MKRILLALLVKLTYAFLNAIARRLERSALPAATIVDVQVSPASAEPALPALPDQTTTSSSSNPVGDRRMLVQALLDEAWAQGLCTYTQLIEYVKLQTGTACSRRAVATWKKARGLMDVDAA